MQADQNPEETDAEIRRVCSILESVASQYAPSAPKHQAIRDAATAFVVVHQHRSLASSFRKLKSSMGSELTPEMADKLRGLRLDSEERDTAD